MRPIFVPKSEELSQQWKQISQEDRNRCDANLERNPDGDVLFIYGDDFYLREVWATRNVSILVATISIRKTQSRLENLPSGC